MDDWDAPDGIDLNGPLPHHKIQAIEVSGGFLDGTRLEFVDGLNCIIGGRGTGKTTVLEFIRYVLDLMPDPADSRPRAKIIDGIVRGNLGSGTIALEVETKHGTSYRAERPWGDSVQVLDEDGDPVSVSLDRDLVFKADIYSQNEIEEIATNPRFQLSLIDKFEEEEIRAVAQQMQHHKRAIESSAVDLRNLDQRIREIEEVVPELDVVMKRLEEMQAIDGPEAELINAAHANKALRSRETEAIADLRDVVGSVADDFKQFAQSVAEDTRNALGDGLEAGPNAAIIMEIKTAVAEFTKVFLDGVPKIKERCDTLLATLEGASQRLLDEHGRQEQSYREIVARSTLEKQRAVERGRLQHRHLELSKAKMELETLKQKRKVVENTHRQMLANLSDTRDRRFMLRKAVAERLTSALSPTIRVSIIQAGDRSGYRELLSAALKGSGIQYNRIAERIVESVSPEELSQIIRRGNASRLAERAGIAADLAQKVVGHIQSTDFAFKLETIDLEDEPQIELKDGADYKNSAGLSTGQRCTVILPILLFESERPLLIDQPEDNLDNAYVYDTIVKSLREVKRGRQLIFVTHNPNIPVLGEAERVFVFNSDGRHGTVSRQGSVDDVKGHIEYLLEGGAEAFKLRMAKYGH
jgi:ABC-type lipoprotein export system ATPase subunit